MSRPATSCHWRYLVDSVVVSSSHPLAASPVPGECEIDLAVEFGRRGATDLASAESPKGMTRARYPSGWMRGGRIPRATVSADGRSAFVSETFESPEESVRVVRGLLPVALGRQGTVVLHAAALDRAGTTVAISGGSGVGKSTLAAELANDGWAVIADDLLPTRREAGEVFAYRRTRSGETRAGRLTALCFLSRGEVGEPVIERLHSAEALQMLLRNGFGEIGHLDETRVWASQFEVYAGLVERADFFRLVVPDSFAAVKTAASLLTAALRQ